jgi:hypothetical protein
MYDTTAGTTSTVLVPVVLLQPYNGRTSTTTVAPVACAGVVTSTSTGIYSGILQCTATSTSTGTCTSSGTHFLSFLNNEVNEHELRFVS